MLKSSLACLLLTACALGGAFANFTLADDSCLYPARYGDAWGYMDIKGNQAIEALFDQESYFHDGFAVVAKAGLRGYLDIHGKFYPMPHCDHLGNFSGGIAKVSVAAEKDGSTDTHSDVYYINNKMMRISNVSFSDGKEASNGIAPVKISANDNAKDTDNSDRWNAIGIDGKLISNRNFSDVGQYAMNRMAVLSKGAWGYIDSSGAMAIPPKYENASEFSDGLACISINGTWGYIDLNGHLKVDCKYERATNFSSKHAAVVLIGQDKWSIINLQGDIVASNICHEILPFKFGHAPASMNGRWGVVTPSGQWRVPPIYDYMSSFYCELLRVGIFAYKKHCYINLDGKEIALHR